MLSHDLAETYIFLKHVFGSGLFSTSASPCCGITQSINRLRDGGVMRTRSDATAWSIDVSSDPYNIYKNPLSIESKTKMIFFYFYW